MKQHFISLLAATALSLVAIHPALPEGHEEGRKAQRPVQRPAQRHELHNRTRIDRHRVVNGWSGERDIRHFETRHLPVWRDGTWHHARYRGRLGWWWVVAGTWYFYPAPVYPYPDPYIPPVVVQAPAEPPVTASEPPPQFWYYCEDSQSYYPYVATCASAWKAVPATPPAPAN